jgi:hypothetical protein
MYPHRIRLLGPWECESLSVEDGVPPSAPRRFTPPGRFAEAELASLHGPLRLTRRFGFPGRIDSYEHVWLVFPPVPDRAELSLNGKPLGSASSAGLEVEVTGLLAARNRLEVTFDAVSAQSGLGEVALEIRRDAFLRDVKAHRAPDGSIHVLGEVVGTSSIPLELYVLGDGKTTVYQVVDARAQGARFDVFFMPEKAVAQIRVELICGAERWDGVEVGGAGPAAGRETLDMQ